MCDHVVAFLHSFVDEIDFIVNENSVIFNLLLKECEGFLLRLKFILNPFEYALLEHLRIICGHPHDVLYAIMKWSIVFLKFLHLIRILYDFVLDWVDYLLDDFSDAGLHFKPLELLDRRTSSDFVGLFGVFLNEGHAINLIIKLYKFIYFLIESHGIRFDE